MGFMTNFREKRPGLFRVLVVLVVVILVAAVVLGVIFDSVQEALGVGVIMLIITAAVLLLGWWLIDVVVKLRARRKQKEFDEKIAAQEGIADRKKEWARWTQELSGQAIDRYSLPFYMLVGEPAAGKSVLLQNSGLHFPFGQSRLSGPGGTRGCDWWFTDQAVILDIAGRLFTHEGGKADEAEWDAFLGLLTEYRPLRPANGVLLVIPCDSLLGDEDTKTQAKAAKIRDGLVSLVRKLDAQLPVYLVLTKADRILGFAETVHKLDTDTRVQMFGWSRAADEAQKPFEMHEFDGAFESIARRAHLMRAKALAEGRVPDAQDELDRMYAFPEELRAMQAPLAAYIRTIFGESSLTDRVLFRGMYVCSGLQKGAPIAQACRELMGGTGEADRRDLEGIFTRQRPYFIGHLLRNRVFEERGLVKPSSARVRKARQTARYGYGGAAAVVILATLWFGKTLVFDSHDEKLGVLTEAVGSAEGYLQAGPPSLAALLPALGAVLGAADADMTAFEQVYGSSRDDFRDLYTGLFERDFFSTLHADAAAAVERRAEQVQTGDLTEGPLEIALETAGHINYLRSEKEWGTWAEHRERLEELVDTGVAQGGFAAEQALAEYERILGDEALETAFAAWRRDTSHTDEFLAVLAPAAAMLGDSLDLVLSREDDAVTVPWPPEIQNAADYLERVVNVYRDRGWLRQTRRELAEANARLADEAVSVRQSMPVFIAAADAVEQARAHADTRYVEGVDVHTQELGALVLELSSALQAAGDLRLSWDEADRPEGVWEDFEVFQRLLLSRENDESSVLLAEVVDEDDVHDGSLLPTVAGEAMGLVDAAVDKLTGGEAELDGPDSPYVRVVLLSDAPEIGPIQAVRRARCVKLHQWMKEDRPDQLAAFLTELNVQPTEDQTLLFELAKIGRSEALSAKFGSEDQLRTQLASEKDAELDELDVEMLAHCGAVIGELEALREAIGGGQGEFEDWYAHRIARQHIRDVLASAEGRLLAQALMQRVPETYELDQDGAELMGGTPQSALHRLTTDHGMLLDLLDPVARGEDGWFALALYRFLHHVPATEGEAPEGAAPPAGPRVIHMELRRDRSDPEASRFWTDRPAWVAIKLGTDEEMPPDALDVREEQIGGLDWEVAEGATLRLKAASTGSSLEDIERSIPGSWAPLLMAWDYGLPADASAAGGESGRAWSVSVPLRNIGTSAREANMPIVVEFDALLPPLPAGAEPPETSDD